MGIAKLSPVEKSLILMKYGDVSKAKEKIQTIEKELKHSHKLIKEIDRIIPKDEVFKESFKALKQKYKNTETFKNT